METLHSTTLRCRHCSFIRAEIITPEYARTLRIQHEFRYDHVVEETNA